MAHQLIATKLQIPKPRRDLVQRDRLMATLEHGTQSRFTLISAPAGFGKTTLLATWLAGRTHDAHVAAWVSLDRSDNETAAFWTHLVAALQRAATGLEQDLPALFSDEQPPDRGLTVALLNRLADLTGELDIVLDDFHVIDDAAIVDELGFFLDHLPPNVHLVISTRSDPPLPLARFRARGELAEIRSADLRFRPGETADYFAEVMKLHLASDEIARLGQRTEGWIAALQLAALSMRGRDDVPRFVATFAGSDRYVVDYLVEEVLRSQPEGVRRFLYGTSILGRFTGDLCDAVMGLRGSTATIDMLDQQNLFVVALDDRRHWFRYHHLFADALQAHMQQADRDRLAERHRTASVWFEAHGDRGEAIRHALAAQDFELAADLIERASPEMQQRRDSSLRGLIEALPDDLVRQRPALSIGLVGPLLQAGLVDGIVDRLNQAESRLRDEGPDALRKYVGAIELYRSALARMRGDLEAATTHAQQVFELAPADAHVERAGAAGFLAIVAWSQGELAPAQRHWRDCTDGLLQIGYRADALGTLYAGGQIAMAQGDLDEAERLFRRGLSIAAEGSTPLMGSADLCLGLAEVALERNDLAAARDWLEQSESGDLRGMPQSPSRRLVVHAGIAFAEGDLARALALLDDAARLHVGDFFPNARPIEALRARVHIALRDWSAVERWHRDSGVGPAFDTNYVREFEQITLARFLLAKGENAAGLSRLDELFDSAASHGRLRAVIEIEMLRALQLDAAGDATGARSALRRALDLAEPRGQVRMFVDEGEPMAALLRAAAKARGASPYVRTLLAGFGAPRPARPIAHPDLLEPLSDRELDVLKLLRGELSGPDIANELHISLNTVRTHTKNIFDKLAVNSRRAAVRRAEEMNLLRRDRP